MTFEERFLDSAKALLFHDPLPFCGVQSSGDIRSSHDTQSSDDPQPSRGVPSLHDVLSEADTVVAGFSGGADSTVLLWLLTKFYANADIRAIHINHMIRGEMAERDEAHCRAFCEKMGIPLEVRRIDVPALAAERRDGLEQAAREARYAAFDEYLADIGGDRTYLCTAHNADDNLETVIFNLIRGSGARGMGGIAPCRGRILRPMLGLSGAQIREFAAQAGLDVVFDETNADVRYTRNLIRSEVIPLLRQIAPECAISAAAASALIRRDDAFIAALASQTVAGRTAVPLSELRLLDDVVLSRALLEMYSARRGERTDFGSVHISDCIRLIRENGRGEICLPGAFSMYVTDGEVSFARTCREHPKPSFEHVILCPGEMSDPGAAECSQGQDPFSRILDFPDDGFCIAVEDPRGSGVAKSSENFLPWKNIYKKSIHATIGFGKIKGTMVARNRRAGDTILFCGMSRKLKKLLCDKKIPDRDHLPVICVDDGVLFVPGIGVRDGVYDKDGLRITVWR